MLFVVCDVGCPDRGVHQGRRRTVATELRYLAAVNNGEHDRGLRGTWATEGGSPLR